MINPWHNLTIASTQILGITTIIPKTIEIKLNKTKHCLHDNLLAIYIDIMDPKAPVNLTLAVISPSVNLLGNDYI